MTMREAEQNGYIVNMHISDATADFKQRLLSKMRRKNANISYILADNGESKECVLMSRNNSEKATWRETRNAG